VARAGALCGHRAACDGPVQITTGVIEGAVVDASGAVLPGVVVEARNVDTNLLRTAVTGREGRFALLRCRRGVTR